MPILQVFCPTTSDIDERLDSACRAVADCLDLDPGDVVATHVPVTRTMHPGHEAAEWPVVTVHSSRRPEDDVRRAVDALQVLADRWAAGGSGAGWVSWLERA